MPKNIVLCCDGTGNEYGDRNTNVLKLFSVLERGAHQVAYYDPGVGTSSAPAALTKTARAVTKVFGLAFGYGITRNVADAYRFLMESYEEGDRIYLFGFSRGAYTVRAVAALLYKCGLLERGNENLVPYALKLFKYERRQRIYRGFRETFSRRPRVRFLGLWDTVKTVGWIYNPLTLQFTMRNPIVDTVRHALAIDERRCFYRQNLWGERYGGQDVRQVWFAGVHSDVGGSYPEEESGLAQITLQWMVEQGMENGLAVDEGRLRVVVPPPAAPDGADGGGARASQTAAANPGSGLEDPAPPDATTPIHRSLRGIWWIPELLPRRFEDPRRDFKTRWMISFGRRRWIGPGSMTHRSVLERMDRTDYLPPNLPGKYEVEGTDTA